MTHTRTLVGSRTASAQGRTLLVQAGTQQQVAEAEQCFQQARTIARCQQAKALELRAVMSLGYLWQAQGKRAAAHQVLADLQEARALLAACTC